MEFKTLHKRIPGRKLKVAAYARISNEERESSLLEQISYYVSGIIENPNWEFSGVFYDDGISGTTIEYRIECKNMIKYAKSGMIDIILVKSVSRFARNVIDLISIKRELAGYGVEIYFEQQQLSSIDPSCDFALTLYAHIAESEIISMSKNVKWRVDKNMREGRYYLPVNQMLGYRYDEDGEIIIFEDEAKWIREIFYKYASGEGCTSIANWLNVNGIKTGVGAVWNDSKVRGILRNEKYVGDVLFQKSYIENPLTHKKINNSGQRDQYLLQNAHPNIIDRNTWNLVQQMLTERAKQYKVKSHELDNIIESPTKATPYAAFIKCPYCGRYYQSKVNHYKGKPTRFMMCASNKDIKKCQSEAYKVDELNKIMAKLISELKKDIPSFKKALISFFKSEDELSLKNEIDELTHSINSLSQKCRYNVNSEDTFLRMTANEYLSKAINESIKKNALVMRLVEIENPEDKANAIIKALNDSVTEPDLIENSNFKELFSNCVIVNQELIYFVIGKHLDDNIPKSPTLLYESVHEYIVRKTTFKTKYGIIINK